MKNPLLIGVVAVICLLAALLFWRAGVSRAALRNGPLSSKVDALAAGWNADNIPPESRKVTFVISDTEMDDMVGKLYAKDTGGGGAAEINLAGDTLPTGGEPSVFGKMADWTRRTFFRGGLAAPEETAFAGAFANTPGALTWSHSGFSEVGEDEMARELMKAILKANDAGAEINIITHGVSAVAAYKAVNSLKDVVRNSGPVEINRLVSVEMNKATLKKLDPAYFNKFGRPKNIREWLNVWTTSSRTQPVTIELFTPTVNGIRFPGRDLFPMLGVTGEISAKDLTRLVAELTRTAVALDRLLGYWSGVAKAKAEAKAIAEARAADEARPKTVSFDHVASRDIKGRAYYKDEPAKAAPQDSLSAIGGGWLKEEQDQAKKEERTTETAQTTQKTESQADSRTGNAANCKGNPPRCNWWDAKAYCGGRLPSVVQLQAWYNSECAGGRNGSVYCNRWVWSGEESGSYSARGVYFGTGVAGTSAKGHANDTVRCR